MKLAIFTRRVDDYDSRSSFVTEWIRKIAKKVDYLYVVCIERGKYSLPKNVKVLYLGSNKLSRMARFLWKNPIRRVDAVLCHMSPIYTIMFAPSAKWHKKALVMWYAHGIVSTKLKLAHKFADKVLTSSLDSFRIDTPKRKVIGHGIDTDKFVPKETDNKEPILLTVGRISPIKDLEDIIKTEHKLVVIGAPTDMDYYLDVVRHGRNVEWVGGLPHNEVVEEIQNCDIFVSNSHTGSVDKACLEAMSCGKPILTSNEAIANILGDYKEQLTFKGSKEFEEKVENLLSLSKEERKKIGRDLREIVVKNHNLDNFIDKLIEELKCA